jgi:hypothetical protein
MEFMKTYEEFTQRIGLNSPSQLEIEQKEIAREHEEMTRNKEEKEQEEIVAPNCSIGDSIEAPTLNAVEEADGTPYSPVTEIKKRSIKIDL